MQLETQNIGEDVNKMEEEAIRKDMEMKKREDMLREREKQLMLREADNLRKEEEAIREKARQVAERERQKTMVRVIIEGEEADAAKVKWVEDNMKRKLEAEEKRKADKTARRREEDSRRRDARLEGFRHEQEDTHRVQVPPKPGWLSQQSLPKIVRSTSEEKAEAHERWIPPGSPESD